MDSLLSELTGIPLAAYIPPYKLAQLSRDWKQRLEGGWSSRQVTNGPLTLELAAGYRNAVARGGNVYEADLSWRITMLDTESGTAREAYTDVFDYGQIVFSTAGPVDVVRR